MTTYDLQQNIQRLAKILELQRLQVEQNRRNTMLKANQQQQKMNQDRLTLTMRPLSPSKTRNAFTKQDILNLSKNLRKTHIPVPKFQVRFQMQDEDQDRKFQIALKKLKHRLHEKKHQLELKRAAYRHQVAEHEAHHQHTLHR